MADPRICSVDGCNKTALARGWCRSHYYRWKRGGNPLGVRGNYITLPTMCSVEGCVKEATKRGMCGSHYWRWSKYGDAHAGMTGKRQATAWLEQNISHADGECLSWPFSRYPSGYGKVNFRGAITTAHRAMCILAHGEPPTAKHQAAHKCGQGHEGCVNPQHLRWATPSGNTEDRRAHGTLSRFTAQEVSEIRSMKGQCAQSELAEKYGVSRSAINHVQNGRVWPEENGEQ